MEHPRILWMAYDLNSQKKIREDAKDSVFTTLFYNLYAHHRQTVAH